MDRNGDLSLLCRVGARLCALPLASVVETMRPLAVEPIAGAPEFVLGIAIARGAPVPVVDAARLVFGEQSAPSRFVILKVAGRSIALAVEAVIGVAALEGSSLKELPPLLRCIDSGVISRIAALDSELLTLLEAGRVVPEDLHARIETRALAS